MDDAERWNFDKELTVFSDYSLLTTPAKVLVSACSDDNYPFEEFLANLGLREGLRFPYRIPGGFTPLAYKERIPDLCAALETYLKITLERVRPQLKKLVIITHENCGFYREVLPEFMGNEQGDGTKIAEAVKRLFPGHFTQVQIFHAIPTPEKKVNFFPPRHREIQEVAAR